jgi:Mg2+ and Co2+ transporter CorA
MNIGVPGEGDTEDFYAIVGAMTVILVAMVTYFRRRGWL